MTCRGARPSSSTAYHSCRMPVTESVRIRRDTKEELRRLNIHPRETYGDVIRRLIEAYRKCQGQS